MPETVANPPQTHGAVRTEPTDVNVRGILLVGAGLIVVGVIVQLAGYWTFEALRDRVRPGKESRFPLAAQRERLPPEPRLEQIDRMKLELEGEPAARIYAAEEQRLERYGWVDEKRQIVHMPIERAMKIIAAEKRLRP